MGGERQGAALCLGLLGTALRFKGDLAAAAAVLEEGVALNRSVGNAWGIGICLQDLAHAVREQGDARRAAALFSECMAVAQEIKDSRRVAECLEGFAALAVDSGRAERAARWLGTAQALREINGSAVEPVDFAIHASSLAAARKALGEAAFARAWDAGGAMPLQDAIDEAVAFGTLSARDKLADQFGLKGLLTAREQEVAALLAQGLSNPQIADKLVISRRTADRHVSNILDKLGFASRGQITAWAVEQEVSATLG
jgi:DNA-binding CsgD family transcriptional regulator